MIITPKAVNTATSALSLSPTEEDTTPEATPEATTSSATATNTTIAASSSAVSKHINTTVGGNGDGSSVSVVSLATTSSSSNGL